MIINTKFHKKWFARVLCFILMQDIGRVQNEKYYKRVPKSAWWSVQHVKCLPHG